MKRFSSIFLFLLSTVLCLCICLYFNALTPVLENGGSVKDADGLYKLTGFTGTDTGYSFGFTVEKESAYSVTLADMHPFTLTLDGTPLFSYNADSRNVHWQTVRLGMLAPGPHLLAVSEQNGTGPQKLIGGRLSVPKLLLGGTEKTERTKQLFSYSVAAMTGMYAMMSLGCLILYFRRRRKDPYLLALPVVAFLSAIVLILENHGSVMNITYSFYTKIRSPLFLCPVLFVASTGLYLLGNHLPERITRFLTFPLLMALTSAIVVLQFISPYNLNYLIHCLLVLPMFAAFFAAGNSKEARFIAAGYGFYEGARLVIYLVNTMNAAVPGALLVYTRITQTGCFIYLLCCQFIIFTRFADKFTAEEQLVETLDRRVEERTLQLTAANEDILASRRREHDTLTQIFHDLRTPVFHLRGCLDMLETDGSDRAAVLELMKDRTDYLARLTEELLLLAKLDYGRVRFRYAMTDAGEILGYLAEETALHAKEKSLRFISETDPALRFVTDGLQFRRIVENLLGNALKHAESGSFIRFFSGTENDNIVIEVSNGTAGPVDTQKIFERFYHGADSSSTGLGLTIAKQLTEKIGGTIAAHYENNILTIRLVLPDKEESL